MAYAMKLTVALGLQYDSGKSDIIPLAHSPSDNKESPVTSVEGKVELSLTGTTHQKFEFSYRYGVFFLTYNLQGIPDPISENQGKVNMFA